MAKLSQASVVGQLQVIDIGDRRQLFINEQLVASSRRVRLTMNPPQPTGEVLIANDRPWEGGPRALLGGYCSVVKEKGVIRIWYFSRSDAYRRVGYAESEDGIHFSKPELNLCEINGSRANNVVLLGPIGGCFVWADPKSAPEQRYKLVSKAYPGWPENPRPTELHLYGSPDGYRWRLLATPDIGDCDTQSVIFWDDRYGRYVIYTREWVRFEDRNLSYRRVRRLESDDLVQWDHESIVWEADESDLATHTTHTGQPAVDYYGGCVFKYPEAGDLYVMLAQAFWHWQERPPEQRWGASGDPVIAKTERLAPAAFDVRLGFSRDGKQFHRVVDRGPFMRPGPEGRFDSRRVWAMPNPIPMGDELWIYYAGTNLDHDGFVDPASPGLLSGISRATMRLDGFVSADADYTGGELVTPSITFKGNRLELNLDTSVGGCVKVELLDETGKPIDGFTRQEATALWGNSVRLLVTWGDNADVGHLAGRPVELRFIMQDCKLYAFQFKG